MWMVYIIDGQLLYFKWYGLVWYVGGVMSSTFVEYHEVFESIDTGIWE